MSIMSKILSHRRDELIAGRIPRVIILDDDELRQLEAWAGQRDLTQALVGDDGIVKVFGMEVRRAAFMDQPPKIIKKEGP